MDNIQSFSKRYFLSLNEDLKINWKGSGLPVDKEIDINGQPIKPYDVATAIASSWLENVKDVTSKNIEKAADRSIFNAAFNRIAKKIFPTLIGYLIPNVEFDGKNIIETKKATPEQFWKEAWPKVWQEFSSIERGLIQKFTTLNKDTSYKEIMKSLGATLSSGSPYEGYKSEISNQIKLFYDMMGKSFSQMFNNDKVNLSNDLIISLGNDLNNNINGSKIDFGLKKSEEVKGKIEDVQTKDLPPQAKKSFDSVVKSIEDFSKKAFNTDAAKASSADKVEVDPKGDKGSKDSDSSSDSGSAAPIPTDVQSVRKWAKGLDFATKQVIIDTIRSTGMR